MLCCSIKPSGSANEAPGMPLGFRKGDGGGVSAMWAQNKILKCQELSLRINGDPSAYLTVSKA